jgi:hypothetical protein
MTFFLYLIAAAIIQDKVTQIETEDIVSSGILNQVAKDWQTVPFVDIKVFPAKNHTSCPEGYPSIVMERVFYGTQSACDCRGI